MLDNRSRRMQRSCASKVKAFLKRLGLGWATIKEGMMAKKKKPKYKPKNKPKNKKY